MTQSISTLKGYNLADTKARKDIKTKLDKPTINGTNGQILTLDVNNQPVWKTISQNDIINIKHLPVYNQVGDNAVVYVSGIKQTGLYILPKSTESVIPKGIKFIWNAMNGDLINSTIIEDGGSDIYSILIDIDGNGTCIISNRLYYFKYKIGADKLNSSVEYNINVLKTNNNVEYRPKDPYNPTTKKYVDDELVKKIDKPITNGTSGQILTVDAGGNIIWSDPNLDGYASEEYVNNIITDKLDKPTINGTNGQMLALDENNQPIWVDKPIGDGNVDLSEYAKETYVNSKIGEVVNSAPESLNTLKKISDALGGDGSFKTTVDNNIKTKLDKPDIGGNIGQMLVMDKDKPKWTNQPNLTIYMTEIDVNTKIDNKLAGLVDSAPETLDTLKELSDALGGDANFATTVTTSIGTKLNKPTKDGLPEQILALDENGNTIWINKPTIEEVGFVTDLQLSEAIDTRLVKPEIDGVIGQVLSVNENGDMVWVDNKPSNDIATIEDINTLFN